MSLCNGDKLFIIFPKQPDSLFCAQHVPAIPRIFSPNSHNSLFCAQHVPAIPRIFSPNSHNSLSCAQHVPAIPRIFSPNSHNSLFCAQYALKKARDGAVGSVDQRFAPTEEDFMSSETSNCILRMLFEPGRAHFMQKECPIRCPFFQKKSARRRSWSCGPTLCADRGGLYVLRDLEQHSSNAV